MVTRFCTSLLGKCGSQGRKDTTVSGYSYYSYDLLTCIFITDKYPLSCQIMNKLLTGFLCVVTFDNR